MATAFINKRLKPAAATESTLYTVPGSTSTAVSKIRCCNSALETKIRVCVRPLGAAAAAADYLEYDTILNDNDTTDIEKIALIATDKVDVYSLSGSVSFVLFGEETT